MEKILWDKFDLYGGYGPLALGDELRPGLEWFDELPALYDAGAEKPPRAMVEFVIFLHWGGWEPADLEEDNPLTVPICYGVADDGVRWIFSEVSSGPLGVDVVEMSSGAYRVYVEDDVVEWDPAEIRAKVLDRFRALGRVEDV